MKGTNSLELMKKHVQSYCKADNKKAWLALSISLGFQIVSIILIHLNQLFLGWGLHTLVTIRLLVQFHDMAHFSFFSSITLNKIVGNIFGVYLHIPFESWRAGHNYHHIHFGNLDQFDISQTILFTKKQYEAMTPKLRILVRFFRDPIIFFVFTAPFLWFVALFYNIGKRQGILSLSFIQKVLSVVIYTWICPIFGIPALEMWITVYGANIIATMLFHLQHSVNLPYREHKQKWNFDRAALEGSTYLQVPKIFKVFTNGIEYHHIHHLNTNVASYHIQECHNSLQKRQDMKQAANWDKFGINKVSLDLAAVSLLNVMLDEQNCKLIPFSYSWK